MSNELDIIRMEIDAIDSELIRLLGKRLEYAVRTKRFKTALTDEAREESVKALAKQNARWLVRPEFSEHILTEIMAESRAVQSHDHALIGFYGEHGTLSEGCISDFCSSAMPISFTSNQDLFAQLKNKTIDWAIIPFEQVCDTSITEPLALFLESEFSILADIVIKPSYALMTLPESNYREIKIVYGHPEILARSKDFIERTKLQSQPYHESAAAALMLRQDRPLAAGVIAPKICAEIYNLHILKDSVDEANFDSSRFLLIGTPSTKMPSLKAKTENKKTMLYFHTNHGSGNLSAVLDFFSQEKINLLKIESLQSQSQQNSVSFLLEFEGDVETAAAKKVLQALTAKKITYRVLGSYSTLTE